MFTCSNMGWVFAAHLQERVWVQHPHSGVLPFSFYFPLPLPNEYPLMGLVFITCNTRWIWIVSLTTNLHLDSASKMPSHYSFHLPSTHFTIFHTVLKPTPLILKIMDDVAPLSWYQVKQELYLLLTATCSCMSTSTMSSNRLFIIIMFQRELQ